MDLFGFEIRPATADDFPQLSVLFAEVDALHRRARPDLFCKPDGPPREYAEVIALIAGPDSTILVAEDTALGSLIGLVTVMVRNIAGSRFQIPRRVVEVDNLSVSRHARRHGAGRALMRGAVEWSVARGFDAIELGVFDFNLDAINFYSAIGFETVIRRLSLKLVD